MGLRVNTNTNALTALLNLEKTDRSQARTLERLSTGLRINRASDDPSGLVISEQLRTQLTALNRATQNTQNDSNMISTADAALDNVSGLLRTIRDAVTYALNTGSATPAQISAQQDAVNQAVNAIDRIANTTRFADKPLLNGSAGISTVANPTSNIRDLSLRSVSFAPGASQTTFNLNVTTSGRFAQISMTGFRVSNTASITLRITGPRGTADITIAGASATAGAGVSQTTALQSAVNRVAGTTGVFASNVTAGGQLTRLDSQDVGSNQLISLQVIRSSGGTGNTTNFGGGATQLNSGIQRSGTGQDYQVALGGNTFKAVGRAFSIVNQFIDAKFNLQPRTPNGLAMSFTVRNTGLFFQLNTQPLPTDGIQIGIDSTNASALGVNPFEDLIARHSGGLANSTTGGFLTDLRTGNTSDLTTNPGNATNIVDAALNKVNAIRGFLGAIGAQTLTPNIDTLGVAIQNLTASESSIRDLNFAEETSRFTKNQILFQAGTAVLASANLIPQTILTLLR